jgi:GNAT superfamily N-acetyltransferase
MTPADLQSTAYVRKEALHWLSRDQGREPGPWEPFLAPHFQHLLTHDPDGSFVAEINGLAVGFAMGFVRGDIWFLSQLFLVPEVHGTGVGRELLRLAVEYADRRKARVRAVIASSSPVAQRLYMRAGMFGRGNMFGVHGSPVALRDSLSAPDANRKRVVDCSGWLDQIAALDDDVWGADRRIDHEFYLGRGDVEKHSFALTRDGVLEGYGYVDARGFIGPLAAREPEGQLPLLRMAAEWLADRGVEEGRTGCISFNETMMSAFVAAGWKYDSWTYFLSSEPFGQFDRFHPSGGVLL